MVDYKHWTIVSDLLPLVLIKEWLCQKSLDQKHPT